MTDLPDQNNALACLRFAKQLLRGRGGNERDFELAVTYFDCAAQLGELDAMYCLGKCYWRGVGCMKDVSGAISCFENAANRGHIGAARKLARCFAEGLHAPKSESLAQYWELRAEALEHSRPRG